MHTPRQQVDLAVIADRASRLQGLRSHLDWLSPDKEYRFAMQDVSAANLEHSLREGATLVFFHAPSLESSRAAEPLLRELAPQLRKQLKVLRLDVEAEPSLIDRFQLTALPTCDVVVGGRREARLVGEPSRDFLLRRLRAAGVHLDLNWPAPATVSPLLSRVEQLAERIDQLDERQALPALAASLVSGDTAFRRLLCAGGAQQAADAMAPAYFACIRELALLLRYLLREVKNPSVPVQTRVGLASALTFFAIDFMPKEAKQASGGACFLDDWLVLRAAWVQFVDRFKTDLDAMNFQTLAAWIVCAVPRQQLPFIEGVVHAISRQAEALSKTPAAISAELLDDLLHRAIPSQFVPPLLPCPGSTPATRCPAMRLANGWRKQPVDIRLIAGERAQVRFDDGSTLVTHRHATVAGGPRGPG